MESRRPRPRRRPHRQRFLLLAVAGQLPAAAALLVAGGAWPLLLVPAAVLTWAFLTAFRTPWSLETRNRAHRALGVIPFLAWWVACVWFVLLAPIAFLLSLLSPAAWPLTATACAALGAASVWRRPRVVRIELAFPELPPALDGLTVVQLSDLHCGDFVPEEVVRDWVRRANRLEPDVVAVTGDLVASGTGHVAAVARALGGLRARRGVYASMGNHDYFGAGEPLVRALEASGLTVLRNAGVPAGDGLVVAGVDDTWTGRADVARALARRGDFTLLLAHDPELFPRAAALGADLTLSGHTHAGQLAVPWLVSRWNLARAVYRYSHGIYRDGARVLYVNAGLGFTGPPVRVGARGEITHITLRRAA
jgi:predicted MPP superfamily phosphohydrolase